MSKTMKWKDIVSNANKIKNSVDKLYKLPSITGYTFAELLVIFCESVKNPKKDISISKKYNNCTGCTGSNIYSNLSKTEYLDVATRTVNFMNKKRIVPNYTVFGKSKIKPQLLLFALSKIIIFYNKNGRLPATCWFAQAVFKKPVVVKGKMCKILTEKTGMAVVDYKSLYKAMSKFSYNYYYDDKQTQSKTLSRMAGNCVDLNQVEYKALRELYSSSIVQIVRGTVRCSDGKVYGHVWCRIKVNGKWINIDASAAAKGKSLGTVICPSVVSVTDINPSWAVNDTGDG